MTPFFPGVLPSALPVSSGINIFMTLPISLMETAPVSAMAFLIKASTSSSDICAGKNSCTTLSSASSFSTKSVLPPLANCSMESFLCLTSAEIICITSLSFNESEVMQIISALVKQRKDSIEQFAKGGRTDLVEKEEAELKVVQEFLPAQMSDEEVEALIKKAIAETGAVSIKDMGKVMKILMPELTGRADGKTAGEKVKEILSR